MINGPMGAATKLDFFFKLEQRGCWVAGTAANDFSGTWKRRAIDARAKTRVKAAFVWRENAYGFQGKERYSFS